MMKKYFVYATAVVLLIVAACTKTETTIEKNIPASNIPSSSATSIKDNNLLPVFNRWVGGPIDGDVGRKWIANHLKFNKPFSYVLTAKALQHILDQPQCVGISFYYAMEGSTLHVLPYGVDENGYLMKTATVATGKGDITWKLALEWRAAYRGFVKAHFWGANTLVNMIKEENMELLRFTQAKRDDGKEELLISNDADSEPKKFMDTSIPCPSVCAN